MCGRAFKMACAAERAAVETRVSVWIMRCWRGRPGGIGMRRRKGMIDGYHCGTQSLGL